MAEKIMVKNFEGLSQYRPPLCFELTGKSFTLVMDNGYDYILSFTDNSTLTYGETGKAASTYAYECLKGDDTTYFVNFEVVGAKPRQGLSFVLDIEQSLVSCIIAYQGMNPKLPGMVSTEVVFGAIQREDGTIPPVRHGYTTDMLGMGIQWSYGSFDVVHAYNSERYYRLMAPESMMQKSKQRSPEELARIEERRKIYPFCEEPALYIKIKDGLYLFSFVEENACRRLGQGNNMLFLMNLNRLIDVGRSFGYSGTIGEAGERYTENYTFGAYGAIVSPEPVLSRESAFYIK